MTAQVHRQQNPAERPHNRWFTVMLAALLLLYWVFAWFLERIDLTAVVNQYWLPGMNVPQVFVFLVEMVQPRVLRHLVPAIVGWLLARGAAVNLVQVLYDLPTRETAREFLAQLQSRGALLGRFVRVKAKTLEEDREHSALLRLGGPGRVHIGNTHAAVTELNGRFYQVLKPGVHRLGRLERIYTLVDLRQQVRTLSDIPLTTKDGIDLKAEVTLTYRINTGGEPPTKARPFPFDPESARLAAYAETVLPDGGVSNWENTPGVIAKGQLTGIIAGFRLDQILYPRSPGQEPMHTIRRNLERRVSGILINFGIELINITIGQLQLPDLVVKQYIAYWQADWNTQIDLTKADGEAFALEEIEIARAEAEFTMIRAIIEGVQRARQEGGTDQLQEVVALRLIEAIEKIAEDSQQFNLPAHQMMQQQWMDWRRQIRPGLGPR